mgnify:CR=1 FL=1
MPPIFFRHYPMTSPKPDHSTDPNSTMPDAAPFMATEPAMVALKHPHSNAVAWVMTAVYFAALFAAVPILALLFLITMPLGVRIDNPRRTLHLWTTGLVASGVFIAHARGQVKLWGGVEAAWAAHPAMTGVLVGGAMLGVLALLWHLTWVGTPLAQQRRS